VLFGTGGGALCFQARNSQGGSNEEVADGDEVADGEVDWQRGATDCPQIAMAFLEVPRLRRGRTRLIVISRTVARRKVIGKRQPAPLTAKSCSPYVLLPNVAFARPWAS
jgi:hypothetical protein